MDDRDVEVLPGTGIPRWVPWLGAIVVVGLLVVLMLDKLGTAHLPSSSSASLTSSPAIAVGPPATGTTGSAVPLSPNSSPRDVAVLGDRTILLQGGSLLVVRAGHVTASRIDGLGVKSHLVVDRPAGRLWVLANRGAGSVIRGFDARTLHPEFTLSWPRAIEAAAGLAGELYVSDRAGVERIGPSGETRPRIGAPGAFQLVADPTRSRMLLVIVGPRSRVVVIESGEEGDAFALPPGLVKATLGVTGAGRIWLAGFATDGAVLADLDPVTFAPIGTSSLAHQLGPGAVLLASGTYTLLVGSGGGANLMWCVDGASGAPVQFWPLSAEVAASSEGQAYVVTDGQLVPLELHGGCTG